MARFQSEANMKKNVVISLWLAIWAACLLPAAGGEPITGKPRVEIAYRYVEQKVMASNQFAIWVENSQGVAIKTIFATSFTGKKKGWDFRENSLPVWVERANVPEMTDNEVDAVSRATPTSGLLSYDWDLRDDKGKGVPPGVYSVFLEGSLRNDNQALYKAEIQIGGGSVVVRPTPAYKGNSVDVRGMIDDVRISYVKP